ncbi:MAG TPA: hypothetical protein VGJ28_16070 [Micromonosporaceae bacterium]|jgi:peptidoglycan/LPS O-acetylase OafA/YrhL
MSNSMQRRTTVVTLMAAVAASLVVVGSIHVSRGTTNSGIPELVIAVVMALTAFVAGRREQWSGWALGGTGFAIAGFLIGLTFTLRANSIGDLAYHLCGLTALVITFALAMPPRKRLAARR